MVTPNMGLEIELLGSKVVAPLEADVGTLIREEVNRIASVTALPIVSINPTYGIMGAGGFSFSISGLSQKDDSGRTSLQMRVTYEGNPLGEVRHAELVRQLSSMDYVIPEKRVAVPLYALLNAI